jgi:hypothetical protein
MGVDQENNASYKTKEIQSAGVLEIEIKCISCLCHSTYKNKTKGKMLLF